MDDDDPTPDELVARLIALLEVQQLGPDRFLGRRKLGGVGRVYGGQVVAQALAAAQQTVDPGRAAHSLHAYFLRGGSEDHEIEYRIERDFDGGSFSNRRVVASQQGQPIFNCAVSFHRSEPGLSHQAEAMPAVAAPDQLASEAQLYRRSDRPIPEPLRRFLLRPRPVELRPCDPASWLGAAPAAPRIEAWLRTVAPLPDDPRLHRAVLAWASDMVLLGASIRPHGRNPARGELIAASLDHAVWFHDDVRCDEWLLYAADSPWTGHARGFNRGRLFARDGRLVAETAQEGLIRPPSRT